jgi:hypothetical protein
MRLSLGSSLSLRIHVSTSRLFRPMKCRESFLCLQLLS